MKRTTGVLESPCLTLDDCKVAIREIVARGLAWHLEDDPHETIAAGLPFFTGEEADDLQARAREFYSHDWPESAGGCPIGYLLSIEE